jgi:hypothetical protein
MMLDFRPNLRVPLVLSTVTICLLLSQVQAQTPPACAIQCGETAASQAGCDMSVFQSIPTTLSKVNTPSLQH